MHNPKLTIRHGFTLIELLVVIAIISLLVSILLPSLQKAKDLARQTVCLSRHKQIGLAIAMYTQDSGGILMPVGGNIDKRTAKPWRSGQRNRWMPMLLESYLPAREIWQCPDLETKWITQDHQEFDRPSNIFWNGTLFQHSHVDVDYDKDDSTAATTPHKPVNISYPSNPSQVSMTSEHYGNYSYYQRCFPYVYSGGASRIVEPSWFIERGSLQMHNDGSNLLFLDGSAAWINAYDITTGMFGLSPRDETVPDACENGWTIKLR